VRLPRLAESISEAVLVEWLRPDGALVEVDEPIATLETDKAAVEIAAEQRGVLRHGRALQERVQVGDVLARIEDAVAASATAPVARSAAPLAPPVPTSPPRAPSRAAAVAEAPALSPAVRRLVEEHALDASSIVGTGKGGRLLKEDVVRALDREEAVPARDVTAPSEAGSVPPAARAALPPGSPPPAARAPIAPPPASAGEEEADRIVPMSTIRLRIAERLVRAQHTAAILTTFNEVDMSAVLALRARHREGFEQRHGVRLGFMSFFARASILALREIPELNAEIRGTDIVYHPRVHLGIAVQTARGLVVPVVPAADGLAFAAIEREIARLAERAREHRLTLDELSGGTFTITNAGNIGGILATPIINFPEIGILGVHRIQKKPGVVESPQGDRIEVRQYMNLSASVDHRLADGASAARFLVTMKRLLENPGLLAL